jgi:hypothetical protein
MLKHRPDTSPKDERGNARPGADRKANGDVLGLWPVEHLRSLERAPLSEDAAHPADPLPRSTIVIAVLFLLVIIIGVCALTWAIFQQK